MRASGIRFCRPICTDLQGLPTGPGVGWRELGRAARAYSEEPGGIILPWSLSGPVPRSVARVCRRELFSRSVLKVRRKVRRKERRKVRRAKAGSSSAMHRSEAGRLRTCRCRMGAAEERLPGAKRFAARGEATAGDCPSPEARVIPASLLFPYCGSSLPCV